MAKLYKGSEKSSANNAKPSRRSSGLSVPFQPVKGGTKVLRSEKSQGASRSGEIKLRIRTKN